MLLAVSCASETGVTTLATSLPETSTIPVSPFFDGDTATVAVGEERLVVAVADTSAERSQGLRAALDLGGLDGMLFIHDAEGPVTYGMRDTLIPLDIWFIDALGTIVGTTEMEPCDSEPCPSYPSPSSVLRVLETELGRYDFSIGDSVSFD
ncbi:MAG: DUF192 domain-containing protein [Acidimicrobiia bacterium]